MDLEKAQSHIDQYLSGEMTPEEQLWFEEEVAKSDELAQLLTYNQKLYSGIEAWGHDMLRERLDGYYQDFLKEEAEEENNGKLLPLQNDYAPTSTKLNRGYVRWLMAAAAVAAILIVVSLVFNRKSDNGPNMVEEKPTKGIIDTVKTVPKEPEPQITEDVEEIEKQKKPSPKELKDDNPIPKEPRLNKITVESTYALAGMSLIPPERVKAIRHPQDLTYTFDQSTLTIFGDPLLIPLRMKLIRKGNKLYFQYAEKFHLIQKTTSVKPLKATPFSPQSTQTLDENIHIVLANVKQAPSSKAPIEVWVGPAAQNSYRFDAEDGKSTLVLTGNFPKSKMELYVVNEKSYYLLIGDNIFSLDPTQKKATLLRRINASTTSVARLFEKNRAFDRKVLKSE